MIEKTPFTTTHNTERAKQQAMPGAGVGVDEQEASAASQRATINPSVIKKLIQLHWGKDGAADGAKINPDAVVLATEYLRLFVIEAHERAQLEAELDNDETVEPHHIERIMLGMLLDF